MRILMVPVIVYSLLAGPPASAQYYYSNDKFYETPVAYEVGFKFGVMNSLTDVGGKKGVGKNFIKDLTWKFAKPCFGMYMMAMYQHAIGLRLEATFGEVMGYDSILKPVKETTFGRYERNLSFKSRIADFQLSAEVHPLYFRNFDDEEPPRFSPYAVIGIGYFSFEPQARLNGRWYSLQHLRTEGQGFAEYPDRQPYKLNQINFAGGLGLKYEINSMINARLEVNHRILRTDYLDDVSTTYIDPALFANYLPANRAAIAQQLYNRKAELDPNETILLDNQRGDPEDDDAFFTIQLKIGFILGRQKR